MASALRLKAAGIENAGLDARILVSHGLKLDRAQLLAQPERILTERETKLVGILIECRARHEPVARILGEREFWSLPFGLNEATLEPRPDSETLIEAVLKSVTDRSAALRILDLGTGTGCLLLSLLHELPNAAGLGIDKAPRAVEQAQLNADRLDLGRRAAFRTGNWLEGTTGTFDIIISNPPYIAKNDIPTLMPEVREHDPHLALDGGEDGLTAYRAIIPALPHVMTSGGFAAFEVGTGQAASVADMLMLAGFKNIAIRKDLSGIERCITGKIA